MRDPYEVIGVAKSADQNEIKRAFRKLAKKLHPDANKADPKSQEKFAELNGAYEILGDAEKRGKFDRGEIDAEGKPRGFEGFGAGGPFGGFRRGPGAGPGGTGFRQGPHGETVYESFSFGPDGATRGGGGGFDDVISEILGGMGREGMGREGMGRGGRARGGGQTHATRGSDIEITVPVPLERAVEGGPVKVHLPNGRAVEVKVPARVAEGYRLRLKGQGEDSPFGGSPGDAYVVIAYAQHPTFRVEGADLRAEVNVPLADAVLGAKVRVPTLSGPVELTVPAWTNSGRTFRLRGKGLPKGEGAENGDLLVTARVALPDAPDAELEALMRKRRDGAG